MAIADYNNIVASTLKAYWAPDGKAQDNIFKRSALLQWLQKEAKLDEQGGSHAVAPLQYATNSTFQVYSGYDTLTPAVDEILTAAEFQWKQAAIYIPMSGMEEARNSGDRQIVNLLKAKTENAERTAAEQFETRFLQSAATGLTNDWIGLPSLFNVTAGQFVGNIEANAAWWAPGKNVTAATPFTLTALSNAYNSVSYPGDMCDFEITDQVNWEYYEGKLQPNQRFTDPKMAEAGFHNLMHRGAKVVWSDLMTGANAAGYWYFLNSRHLKLAVLSGKWMNFRGFITPHNQDAKYGLITSYGTLVTNERRKLGRVKFSAPV